MPDLSAQIRATLDGWTERSHPEMQAMHAALLAVLELHAPHAPDGFFPYCDQCGDVGTDWPCPTVRAVAENLGIEAGATSG